ncbi:MAG: hypothetical protein A2138_09710 [Deltaproteobacteria bacterium RBG_16_71_12]|nr:MAG: hypothetical protein A2138_09710 [Deltaproteobacteria bacterium RBG_16_71_12]
MLLPFVVSGAAGLIYQVVWTRLLALQLGASVHSITVVLCAFMLGIGIGSVAGGRLADARGARACVRLYAGAELAIALAGLGIALSLRMPGFPPTAMTFELVDGLWRASGATLVLRMVVGLAVLFVPTFLMGATLSLLVRAAVDVHIDAAASRIGWLYGANTAGAALGCVLADAALIPSFGLFGAQLVAAGLNVAAATSALLLTRAFTADANPIVSETASDDPQPAGAVIGVSLALALSGFAALGMEVVWFRFLTSLHGLDRSVFATVLAVILACFWCGASACGALVARLGAATTFVCCCALFAATTLGALFCAAAAALPSWLPLTAVFVVGVPSLCLGALFPAANALVQQRGYVGRRLSALYVANTAGNVAGAALGGLALLPLLGMQRAAFVLVLAALVAGALVLRSSRQRGPGAAVAPGAPIALGSVVAAVVAIAGYLAMPNDALFFASFQHLPATEPVVAAHEGVNESLVVVRRGDGDGVHLWTNGHPMTGTGWSAQRYMRSMAHIALLNAPPGARALVICFGVGNTASAVASHQDVAALDIVDLSADVLRFGSMFAATNKDVLVDPRVRAFVDDGRRFLAMPPDDDARYDLITLEPPPIRHAGVASLYSREFYSLAHARLAEGGAVTQWLPAYQASPAVTLSLVRAFVDVFPGAVLLAPTRGELILFGRKGAPAQLDVDAAVAHIAADAKVRADLSAIHLADAAELALLFAGGSARLRAATRDVAPLQDDQPLLEYDAAPDRGMLPATLFDVAELETFCPQCPARAHASFPLQRALLARLYAAQEFLDQREHRFVLGYPLVTDAAADEHEAIAASGALVRTFASAPAALLRGRALLASGDATAAADLDQANAYAAAAAEAARVLDRATLIDPSLVEARALRKQALRALNVSVGDDD